MPRQVQSWMPTFSRGTTPVHVVVGTAGVARLSEPAKAARDPTRPTAAAPPTSPRKLRRFMGELDGRVIERSEEHTSELQSRSDLVCRLLLEKKKKKKSY